MVSSWRPVCCAVAWAPLYAVSLPYCCNLNFGCDGILKPVYICRVSCFFYVFQQDNKCLYFYQWQECISLCKITLLATLSIWRILRMADLNYRNKKPYSLYMSIWSELKKYLQIYLWHATYFGRSVSKVELSSEDSCAKPQKFFLFPQLNSGVHKVSIMFTGEHQLHAQMTHHFHHLYFWV